jgi:dihydrolipoamide dehydrogenase
VSVAGVAGPTTQTRTSSESDGFLTLRSDGERLTGAYALAPEAGEWMQMFALAIRARVPLDVVIHTIRPFPTLVHVYVAAREALIEKIAAVSEPVGA